MATSTPVIRHRLVLCTLILSAAFVPAIFISITAHAAGINQQLNFQGRLLNAQGAVVPDGYYNMEFNIYQDGDGQHAGDTTGSPAGSLQWTEDFTNANTHPVTVLNGYFSVQLGSLCSFSGGSCQGHSNLGVNWNSDALWLSMNIGGTNATCTPFSSCSPDGEMLPMKRLSANSYAFNSQMLGGLGSGNFVQLANGLQTDATNNTSLYINKTGTGNILDLQAGGNDAFTVSNSGNLTFGANANHTLSVATGAAGAAGKTLALIAGAAGTDANPLSGGNLTVAAGAGGGTNGNGGNVTIDAGAANGTGTDGTISIGSTHASSVQIGNVTSAVAQTINIGNNATSGSTTNVAIGNLNGASSTTIQAGSGNVNLTTNQAGAGIIIKTATNNSVKALQVQTASGYAELTVDTSGNRIVLGNVTTNSGMGIQGLLAFADGTADNLSVNLQTNGALTAGHTIYLPDESGTICLRNSTNCGFLSGSGSANFINNGTSPQVAANFYLRSNGNTVTGVLEGSNGQTADLLHLNTYNGTTSTTVAKFDATGSLSITNGSANALAVQNTSGKNVFRVDNTTGQGNTLGQAILGQSNAIDGSLLFQNSTDSHTIGINSTGSNSSYTLTLPTSAPATSLCIETSAGNAQQLVFASCTNNNASIQEVHEWDANNASAVTVSPTTVGDEMVITTQIPTSGVTVSSISGGDVATWTKVVTSAGNGTVNRVEMWVGTVTSLGSSPITVNYCNGSTCPSSPGSNEIAATEFTAAGVNASTSWGIESSAAQLNSTASTTVTYPNATAVNGSELYVGYAQVQNPPATQGSTSGFSYAQTSTQHNMITYNTSLAANTSYQPTAAQNSIGESNAVDAVLTAFVTSTSINNATSLQKANFYVQAASGGSVAGVLQAASSGNADIMDLKNSSAVNVVAVGNTGSVILKNSANSATAFQVQDQSGTNVLSVNTLTDHTALGAAAKATGALDFYDSSDSNIITLTAPSSIAATYQLKLPTNTPTAGLCLGTDPSDAEQLIFASCATQVSAAGISFVNEWQATGSGNTSVPDSPPTKGDLLVLFSHTTGNATISGISGGGPTSWTKVTSYGAGGSAQGNVEMWRGVVSTTGSGTVAVSYTGTVGTSDVSVEEYTMGSSNGTWAIDTSGTNNSASSATINYPTLTAQNSSELYTGYAWGANTMAAGTTSGFTWLPTAASKYLAYDPNVVGGTAYTPAASQSVAGAYASIGAMIDAYAGTSVIVDTTATQEANFNVQAATAGTIAGVLQAASSGNTDIFEAKDNLGNNIMAVNPVSTTSLLSPVSSAGTTLGTAGVVRGQLNFAAPNNSNIISLLAPDAPGQSYSLSLPTTSPVAGQCLATSPSNANTLVFSSCANQVTSVAISYVDNWKNTSASQTATLPVTATNMGDLMTLFIYATKGDTVSGNAGCGAPVCGGGVTTWSKIVSANSEDMWRGVVTSTGSKTITVSETGPAGPTVELAAQEWTTGSATGSWVVDTSNTQSNTVASTTMSFPSLTPQSTKDLYVGYGIGGTIPASPTCTTGFTCLTGAQTTTEGIYNTAVSTSVAPTITQSTSSTSITAGALIAAYSSSSVISNSTNTQEANMNVQAATPSSVAAVFQTAAGGSMDAVDILDGNGTLTDSFGSTGNLLVKPSTASAAAFQVQTTGSANVLSVDTGSKLVVVGAGSTGESSPSLLVLDNETGTTADPTVLNGAMYYNATTQTFRCGVDGAWQSCTGLLYSNTSASSPNNNCSNNCSAFTTTASIPANYCQPGRVIKLHAAGYFSSQPSPSNLQFGVYYGTDPSNPASSSNTLLGNLTPAESVSSASNNYLEMNFSVICFSTSTMQAAGILNMQTGSSSAGLTALPMGSSSGTTVVTSGPSAKNLYIFPIWDTANASNTATLNQFTVSAE